jgi:L-amino acid N-acyltransferase YncA
MKIREARPADAGAVAAIYNPYILETIITFEETAVTAREIAARMKEVRAAKLPWLVAEEKGEVVGYACATKWKGRCAYRYSAETAIYLAKRARGRGVGKALYSRLLAALKRRGLHAAIGGVALPNPASVALHRGLGFEKVARFKEVGFKLGRWIDVAYWEVILR